MIYAVRSPGNVKGKFEFLHQENFQRPPDVFCWLGLRYRQLAYVIWGPFKVSYLTANMPVLSVDCITWARWRRVFPLAVRKAMAMDGSSSSKAIRASKRSLFRFSQKQIGEGGGGGIALVPYPKETAPIIHTPTHTRAGAHIWQALTFVI